MNPILRAVLAWPAVLLVLAFGVGVAWSGRASRPALFVNGLEETVRVEVDDHRTSIEAGAYVPMQLKPGAHEVVVRAGSPGGRVLDRHRIVVPPGAPGTGIYSVLGAAPLYRVEARFRRFLLGGIPGMDAGRPYFDAYTPLAGPRFQVVAADQYFQPAPDELRPAWLRISKTYLGCLSGGWGAGLEMALASGPDAEVGPLIERLQRAFPDDTNLPWLRVVYAATSEGSGAGVATAEAGLRAAPESIDAHEAWAFAMTVAGRAAELRTRARELAARAPDSPLAKVMLLRVLPRREAEALARAAAAGTDRDPDLLAAAARVLLRTGRPAEAAALYRELPLRSAQDGWYADALVRALIQAGDPKAAAALALQVVRFEDSDADDLALYLKVAAVPGAAPEVEPQALLAHWAEKDAERARAARALAGLAPRPQEAAASSPGEHLPAILEWVTHDPVEALDLCRSAKPGTLAWLAPEVGSVLALEAYRTGDRDLFERLRSHLPLSAAEIGAYVDAGVEPAEAWRLDAPGRAALALARARTLQASGAQIPADVARAIRGDPLGGPAALAAERWPVPERAEPPVVLVLQPER